MFGAFVLGVPIFAVIIEAIGWKTKEKRYDRLAYEFVKLLSSLRFATTAAALGGLLAFTLFGLFPTLYAPLFDEMFFMTGRMYLLRLPVLRRDLLSLSLLLFMGLF